VPVNAFDLRDACVTRGGNEVLHGIDFTLAPHEFVAVLGANGAGKSTLVRALLGLAPLSHGSLRLFGTPLAEFRQWPRIGYVPQRARTDAGVPATVREVVASGLTASRSRWRPRGNADRTAVTEAIETAGMSAYADRPVAHLSGGQAQRVLIARALVGAPDVLVLDEPTAGVDAESQTAFTETLRRLKERGVGVLLVTHHVGDVAPLVDRVVALRDGEVAYDGPVPEHGMPDDDHHHPAPPAESRWGLG
jgi:zinc transport system ATP-binding protein